MTVCHHCREAMENSSYTVGAVVFASAREEKIPRSREKERERGNPDPNYSTQWVKSSVVPACRISDGTESSPYTERPPITTPAL